MTEIAADTAPVQADTAPAVQNDSAPPAQQPSNSPPSEFTIPDAYKEKAWSSKIKSADDLWKSLDGAQGLIGKKSLIPNPETATPKEIEDFYNGLRPQDKSAYQLDVLPEAERGRYADMLHKHGLSAHQANALVKEFVELQSGEYASMHDGKSFENELKTSFGDDYQKTAGEVARNLKANLSPADTKLLDEMPNNMLGLLYRYGNNIMKAYGAEEGSANINSPGKMPAVDKTALRADLRKRINEMGQRNHTLEEKQALVAQLDATYR